MQAQDSKSPTADVVAIFDDQLDADEAVLQLRLAGLRDAQIGYFSQYQFGGLTNLLERTYEVTGAIIGGIVGVATGVAVAWVLSAWWASMIGVRDLFGLSITLGIFGALFVGFFGALIGMGISRRGVAVPAINPAAGPFILAVSAGELRDRAWDIIHQHGGHEVPPGAFAAHPSAV